MARYSYRGISSTAVVLVLCFLALATNVQPQETVCPLGSDLPPLETEGLCSTYATSKMRNTLDRGIAYGLQVACVGAFSTGGECLPSGSTIPGTAIFAKSAEITSFHDSFSFEELSSVNTTEIDEEDDRDVVDTFELQSFSEHVTVMMPIIEDVALNRIAAQFVETLRLHFQPMFQPSGNAPEFTAFLAAQEAQIGEQTVSLFPVDDDTVFDSSMSRRDVVNQIFNSEGNDGFTNRAVSTTCTRISGCGTYECVFRRPEDPVESEAFTDALIAAGYQQHGALDAPADLPKGFVLVTTDTPSVIQIATDSFYVTWEYIPNEIPRDSLYDAIMVNHGVLEAISLEEDPAFSDHPHIRINIAGRDATLEEVPEQTGNMRFKNTITLFENNKVPFFAPPQYSNGGTHFGLQQTTPGQLNVTVTLRNVGDQLASDSLNLAARTSFAVCTVTGESLTFATPRITIDFIAPTVTSMQYEDEDEFLEEISSDVFITGDHLINLVFSENVSLTSDGPIVQELGTTNTYPQLLANVDTSTAKSEYHQTVSVNGDSHAHFDTGVTGVQYLDIRPSAHLEDEFENPFELTEVGERTLALDFAPPLIVSVTGIHESEDAFMVDPRVSEDTENFYPYRLFNSHYNTTDFTVTFSENVDAVYGNVELLCGVSYTAPHTPCDDELFVVSDYDHDFNTNTLTFTVAVGEVESMHVQIAVRNISDFAVDRNGEFVNTEIDYVGRDIHPYMEFHVDTVKPTFLDLLSSSTPEMRATNTLTARFSEVVYFKDDDLQGGHALTMYDEARGPLHVTMVLGCTQSFFGLGVTPADTDVCPTPIRGSGNQLSPTGGVIDAGKDYTFHVHFRRLLTGGEFQFEASQKIFDYSGNELEEVAEVRYNVNLVGAILQSVFPPITSCEANGRRIGGEAVTTTGIPFALAFVDDVDVTTIGSHNFVNSVGTPLMTPVENHYIAPTANAPQYFSWMIHSDENVLSIVGGAENVIGFVITTSTPKDTHGANLVVSPYYEFCFDTVAPTMGMTTPERENTIDNDAHNYVTFTATVDKELNPFSLCNVNYAIGEEILCADFLSQFELVVEPEDTSSTLDVSTLISERVVTFEGAQTFKFHYEFIQGIEQKFDAHLKVLSHTGTDAATCTLADNQRGVSAEAVAKDFVTAASAGAADFNLASCVGIEDNVRTVAYNPSGVGFLALASNPAFPKAGSGDEFGPHPDLADYSGHGNKLRVSVTSTPATVDRVYTKMLTRQVALFGEAEVATYVPYVTVGGYSKPATFIVNFDDYVKSDLHYMAGDYLSDSIAWEPVDTADVEEYLGVTYAKSWKLVLQMNYEFDLFDSFNVTIFTDEWLDRLGNHVEGADILTHFNVDNESPTIVEPTTMDLVLLEPAVRIGCQEFNRQFVQMVDNKVSIAMAFDSAMLDTTADSNVKDLLNATFVDADEVETQMTLTYEGAVDMSSPPAHISAGFDTVDTVVTWTLEFTTETVGDLVLTVHAPWVRTGARDHADEDPRDVHGNVLIFNGGEATTVTYHVDREAPVVEDSADAITPAMGEEIFYSVLRSQGHDELSITIKFSEAVYTSATANSDPDTSIVTNFQGGNMGCLTSDTGCLTNNLVTVAVSSGACGTTGGTACSGVICITLGGFVQEQEDTISFTVDGLFDIGGNALAPVDLTYNLDAEAPKAIFNDIPDGSLVHAFVGLGNLYNLNTPAHGFNVTFSEIVTGELTYNDFISSGVVAFGYTTDDSESVLKGAEFIKHDDAEIDRWEIRPQYNAPGAANRHGFFPPSGGHGEIDIDVRGYGDAAFGGSAMNIQDRAGNFLVNGQDLVTWTVDSHAPRVVDWEAPNDLTGNVNRMYPWNAGPDTEQLPMLAKTGGQITLVFSETAPTGTDEHIILDGYVEGEVDDCANWFKVVDHFGRDVDECHLTVSGLKVTFYPTFEDVPLGSPVSGALMFDITPISHNNGDESVIFDVSGNPLCVPSTLGAAELCPDALDKVSAYYDVRPPLLGGATSIASGAYVWQPGNVISNTFRTIGGNPADRTADECPARGDSTHMYCPGTVVFVFSERMDPTTVRHNSFTVTGATLDGAVAYWDETLPENTISTATFEVDTRVRLRLNGYEQGQDVVVCVNTSGDHVPTDVMGNAFATPDACVTLTVDTEKPQIRRNYGTSPSPAETTPSQIGYIGDPDQYVTISAAFTKPVAVASVAERATPLRVDERRGIDLSYVGSWPDACPIATNAFFQGQGNPTSLPGQSNFESTLVYHIHLCPTNGQLDVQLTDEIYDRVGNKLDVTDEDAISWSYNVVPESPPAIDFTATVDPARGECLKSHTETQSMSIVMTEPVTATYAVGDALSQVEFAVTSSLGDLPSEDAFKEATTPLVVSTAGGSDLTFEIEQVTGPTQTGASQTVFLTWSVSDPNYVAGEANYAIFIRFKAGSFRSAANPTMENGITMISYILDPVVPTIGTVTPAAEATVPLKHEVVVQFSEPVTIGATGAIELVATDPAHVTSANVPTIANGGVVVTYSSSGDDEVEDPTEGPGDIVTITVDTNNWIADGLTVEDVEYTLVINRAEDCAGTAFADSPFTRKFNIDIVIPEVSNLDAPSIITQSNEFVYTFNTPVTFTGEDPTLEFVGASTANMPVVELPPNYTLDGDNIVSVTYTFTVAPDQGDATYTVRLDGFVSAKSGNPMEVHTTGAINVDVATHTISSIVPETQTVIGPNAVEYTVTFTDDVTLSASDFVVSETAGGLTQWAAATVSDITSGCSGECATWKFTLTMDLPNPVLDTVYITFLGGKAVDEFGNGLTANQQFIYNVDFRVPTVVSFAISEGSVAPFTGATFILEISKAVSSFDANWLTIGSSGDVRSVSPILGSDNLKFTVVVNFPEGTSNAESVSVEIDNENFKDTIGNKFAPFSTTVQVDMRAPRISGDAEGELGFVSSTLPFTMPFTEGVSGLTESIIKDGCRIGGAPCEDITVAITGTDGSDSYGVVVSGFASGIAGSSGVISLSAGDVHDAAGNGFRTSPDNYFSFTVDTVAPVMTVPSLSTFGESVNFVLSFSEPVKYDADNNAISVSVASSGATLTGSVSVMPENEVGGYASQWRVSYIVTPDAESVETGDSTVEIAAASFVDRADNALTAGENVNVAHNFVMANVLNVVFDGTLYDKYYVSTNNNIKVIVEIDREVNFPAESIEIRDETDVVATHSTVEVCTALNCGGDYVSTPGSPSEFYTFLIQSASGLTDGEFTLIFTEQIATPESNALQRWSEQFVVDTVAPTVVKQTPVSSVYNRVTGGQLSVTVEFSEAMRNMALGQVTVGEDYSVTALTQTQSNIITFTISGIPEDEQTGFIGVSFASSVRDLAGNRLDSASVTFRYDTLAPSFVSIIPALGTSESNAPRLNAAAFAGGIDVRYSEATTVASATDAMIIAADDASALTVTGASASGETQRFAVEVGSGEYADMLVSVQLVGSQIVDRAQWPSDNQQFYFVLDSVAPTVEVTTNAIELSKRAVSAGVSDTLEITIVVSEPTDIMSISELVSVVDAEDNSMLGALNVVGPTPVAGQTETYTMQLSGLTESMSPLTIKFDGIREIRDVAGNVADSAGVTDIELTIDTTAPELDASTVTPASGSSIADEEFTVCITTVDAEEAVVTFIFAGISVEGEGTSGTYCATLQSPALGGSGGVSITVEDVYGNVGSPVSVPYTFDSSVVVVIAVEPATGTLPADDAGNAVFSVVFSKEVSGFAATDLIVTQGTVGTPVVSPDTSGNGFRVDYPLSGLTDGDLSVTVSDDTSIMDDTNTPLDIAPDAGLGLPHTVELTVELGVIAPPVTPPTVDPAPEVAPSADEPSGSPDSSAADEEGEGLDGGIIALIIIIIIVVIAVIVIVIVVVVLRKKKKEKKDQGAGGAAAAGAVDVELGESVSGSDSGSLSGSDSGSYSGSHSDDMSHTGSSDMSGSDDYSDHSGSESGSYSDSGSHSHSESGSHSGSHSGSDDYSDHSDDSGDYSDGSGDDEDDYSDDDESDSEVQAVSEGSYSD